MMSASLLRAWQISPGAREMFIQSGYRPKYRKVSDCVRTMVHAHNETLNIWTHLLACIYFVYMFFWDEVVVRCRTADFQRHGTRHIVFTSFVISVILVFAASTFAHIFNCLSATWRDICFMLDYMAINFYLGTSSLICFCLMRPFSATFHEVLTREELFLPLVVVSPLVAMLLCCWTRLHRDSQHHVYTIRTCAFAIPVFVASTPALGRCAQEFADLQTRDGNFTWIQLLLGLGVPSNDMSNTTNFVNAANVSTRSQETGDYKIPETFEFTIPYIYHVIYISAAAILNISRVPERWWPGRFDICGHSHQWFHILVFLGMREQFWLIIHETPRVDARANVSLNVSMATAAVPSAQCLFISLSVMIVGLISIFLYFGSAIAAIRANAVVHDSKEKRRTHAHLKASNGKVD